MRRRDDRARLRLHPARPQGRGAARRDARRDFQSTGQERGGVALRRPRRGALNMANKMPREIAPGVFWIGDCLAQRHKGKVYHGYNAAFLIAGANASVLVETGHPKDFPVIERHLAELFARGVPPLKYLFVTHQETPHCSGGRGLHTRTPETILCGDVSDYHLAFPQFEHRMRWMKEGDAIDLGGRSLMAVEPGIRHLRTTWGGLRGAATCARLGGDSTRASACCFPATASPTATITRTAIAGSSPRRRSRSTCPTSRRCSRTWLCSGPSSPIWRPIAIGSTICASGWASRPSRRPTACRSPT